MSRFVESEERRKCETKLRIVFRVEHWYKLEGRNLEIIVSPVNAHVGFGNLIATETENPCL